jgi:hypothetical protein
MGSRVDLGNDEKKIEAFRNHLTIDLHVARSTQKHAMNALVFLYRHVLKESAIKPRLIISIPAAESRPLPWQCIRLRYTNRKTYRLDLPGRKEPRATP